MNIIEKKVGPVSILYLNMSIDADINDFEIELAKKIGLYDKIILNFSKTSYINSLGLRMILKIVKKLRSGGGKLIICDLNANIRNIFEITGFMQIFEVFDTEEKAIESLR